MTDLDINLATIVINGVAALRQNNRILLRLRYGDGLLERAILALYGNGCRTRIIIAVGIHAVTNCLRSHCAGILTMQPACRRCTDGVLHISTHLKLNRLRLLVDNNILLADDKGIALRLVNLYRLCNSLILRDKLNRSLAAVIAVVSCNSESQCFCFKSSG